MKDLREYMSALEQTQKEVSISLVSGRGYYNCKVRTYGDDFVVIERISWREQNQDKDIIFTELIPYHAIQSICMDARYTDDGWKEND